jgi:predicted deacylase
MKTPPFPICGVEVPAGERLTVDLPIGGLYTHTSVSMPVQVIHGRKTGPVVFVSGALHGDEINGVEIIRRLVRLTALKQMRGTLLAVPIVNVFGFLQRSRYLPDRRDLNRFMPGSEHGSLASRIGYAFFSEIVRRSDLGIDLHTAAIHRDNLPQLRVNLDDPVLRPLAEAFGTPVLLHSGYVSGSLRYAASREHVPVMVYEAGEALRFDEVAIRIGLRGIVQVLRQLGMLKRIRHKARPAAILRSSTWVRADHSGILRTLVPMGAAVSKGDVLGVIADPFGENETNVEASVGGVVIGRTNLPLVVEGEALFHIGRTKLADAVGEHLEAVQAEIEPAAPESADEEPPIV